MIGEENCPLVATSKLPLKVLGLKQNQAICVQIPIVPQTNLALSPVPTSLSFLLCEVGMMPQPHLPLFSIMLFLSLYHVPHPVVQLGIER